MYAMIFAMGLKSFLIKKTLQAKGLSGDQAEAIAKEISEHPELAASLKKLEENKELKELLEKVQKEMAEKVKSGMPQALAQTQILQKYQGQMMKYREELAPLMSLLMKQ